MSTKSTIIYVPIPNSEGWHFYNEGTEDDPAERGRLSIPWEAVEGATWGHEITIIVPRVVWWLLRQYAAPGEAALRAWPTFPMPSPTITVEEASILQAWADKRRAVLTGVFQAVTTPSVDEDGVL